MRAKIYRQVAKSAQVPTWKRINSKGPIGKGSKIREQKDRQDTIMQAEIYQT